MQRPSDIPETYTTPWHALYPVTLRGRGITPCTPLADILLSNPSSHVAIPETLRRPLRYTHTPTRTPPFRVYPLCSTLNPSSTPSIPGYIPTSDPPRTSSDPPPDHPSSRPSDHPSSRPSDHPSYLRRLHLYIYPRARVVLFTMNSGGPNGPK